jgi:chlorophyllide a oxygenase
MDPTRDPPCAARPLLLLLSVQADALLSEDGQERTSVSELRRQLITLQQQVEEAGEKLAATQSRVDQNLQRVERLKREAAALERARGAASAAHAQETPLAAPAPAPALAARAAPAPAPPSPVPFAGAARKRSRGLSSSMEAEPPLKNFWYPCEFSSRLVKDTMVPFELFDEPWVLFRDESGRPACVRDECAHRACPLSLGKVVDGQVGKGEGVGQGIGGGVEGRGGQGRAARCGAAGEGVCRACAARAWRTLDDLGRTCLQPHAACGWLVCRALRIAVIWGGRRP